MATTISDADLAGIRFTVFSLEHGGLRPEHYYRVQTPGVVFAGRYVGVRYERGTTPSALVFNTATVALGTVFSAQEVRG